jgi:hypothetical protein
LFDFEFYYSARRRTEHETVPAGFRNWAIASFKSSLRKRRWRSSHSSNMLAIQGDRTSRFAHHVSVVNSLNQAITGFVDDIFYICRIRDQCRGRLQFGAPWFSLDTGWAGSRRLTVTKTLILVRNSFHGTVPVLGVTWPVNRVEEERCN